MDQPALGSADVRGERENDEAQAPAATPATISLPKGGGAIRGMGEKFAANPVTDRYRIDDGANRHQSRSFPLRAAALALL